MTDLGQPSKPSRLLVRTVKAEYIGFVQCLSCLYKRWTINMPVGTLVL